MVRLDHDQVAVKGFHAVWNSVRFEVSDIRMGHWILPKKLTQVRNHLETMAHYVDTKNSIGKIRIPVAAATASCKGVKLAVDERDISRAVCISRGQTTGR